MVSFPNGIDRDLASMESPRCDLHTTAMRDDGLEVAMLRAKFP